MFVYADRRGLAAYRQRSLNDQGDRSVDRFLNAHAFFGMCG
jgi:hypothetical protein